ncbi:g9492 [Coccomyxa elongata]
MQSALVASPLGQRAGVFGTQVRKPAHLSKGALRAPVVIRAASIAAEDVPDAAKRTTMNLLLLGAASLPIGYMAFGFISLLVPPKVAGSAGGQTAKDAAGNDVKASKWIETHKAGDHSLVQGLKGDATYLVVTENNEIEKFGINAVCTHLGCVVPWNVNENKFMCPCHGSQYNAQGKVVRGPAPLSLALAHTEITDDIVFLTEWKETDFRTGLSPWWA